MGVVLSSKSQVKGNTVARALLAFQDRQRWIKIMLLECHARSTCLHRNRAATTSQFASSQLRETRILPAQFAL